MEVDIPGVDRHGDNLYTRQKAHRCYVHFAGTEFTGAGQVLSGGGVDNAGRGR